MKKNILLVLMIGLIGAVSASAQDDESIEKKLGLTAGQKEQVAELRATWKAKSGPIDKKIELLRADLNKLKRSGASDTDLRKVLKQIADEEIKLTLLLRKFKQGYLKVLTPQQIKLLQKLKNG